MTQKTIEQQNIFEIASMRLKVIIAELDQEEIFKMSPEADVQGVLILWQPSLPSIH